jgi:hypothetical protein
MHPPISTQNAAALHAVRDREETQRRKGAKALGETSFASWRLRVLAFELVMKLV